MKRHEFENGQKYKIIVSFILLAINLVSEVSITKTGILQSLNSCVHPGIPKRLQIFPNLACLMMLQRINKKNFVFLLFG